MSKLKNKTLVTGLFKRYELKIRKFLMLKNHRQEDTEDILQETFLRAHKVSDWQGVENHEAYLVSIAKNAYNDHARKEMRDVTANVADISSIEVEDEALTPEEFVSKRQQIKDLEQVINSLTPRVKQALIFIKILEFSYAETAALMKISRSTLKNHVTIGLAECRRQIGTPIALSDRHLESGRDHSKIISLVERKLSSKRRT